MWKKSEVEIQVQKLCLLVIIIWRFFSPVFFRKIETWHTIIELWPLINWVLLWVQEKGVKDSRKASESYWQKERAHMKFLRVLRFFSMFLRCFSIIGGIVPRKGLLFSIDKILKISHDHVILPSFLRPGGAIYVTVTGIGVNRLLDWHHHLLGLGPRSTRYNRVHFTKQKLTVRHRRFWDTVDTYYSKYSK